jgi:hypothetical protein
MYYLDEFKSRRVKLSLLLRVSHVRERTSEYSVFHPSLENRFLLLCVYVVLFSVLNYCIYQHNTTPSPLPFQTAGAARNNNVTFDRDVRSQILASELLASEECCTDFGVLARILLLFLWRETRFPLFALHEV